MVPGSPIAHSLREAATKLLTDLATYLGGARLFRPLDDTNDQVYPIDLDHFLRYETRYFSPKDRQGIPLRAFAGLKPQYVPTRIAAYGLARLNRYLREQRVDDRETFLEVARWFMASEDARWWYRFDRGRLRAPWISAMAQGQGISVLLRAWRMTSEETFLRQAERAADPFFAPIGRGGVRSSLEGDPFLEEYPEDPPKHVLNGFLFALIGLGELAEAVAAHEVRELQYALLNTLEKHLHCWDLGYWSAYDLEHRRGGRPNPATMIYHSLHIAQLRYLGRRYGRTVLDIAAERWERYARSPEKRLRALAAKVALRLRSPAPRRGHGKGV